MFTDPVGVDPDLDPTFQETPLSGSGCRKKNGSGSCPRKKTRIRIRPYFAFIRPIFSYDLSGSGWS